MKVRYVGESFFNGGGLTDGKEYECLGVEGYFLRIIDDEGDITYDVPPPFEKTRGYLYDIENPAPFIPNPGESGNGGRWEIVEDDESGTLAKALKGVA